jgi:hypothetical protein
MTTLFEASPSPRTSRLFEVPFFVCGQADVVMT